MPSFLVGNKVPTCGREEEVLCKRHTSLLHHHPQHQVCRSLRNEKPKNPQLYLIYGLAEED